MSESPVKPAVPAAPSPIIVPAAVAEKPLRPGRLFVPVGMSNESELPLEDEPTPPLPQESARERLLRAISVLRPGNGVAINGLFLLACFVTLHMGAEFFLPIVLAALLALLLSPVVRILTKLHLPESVGAAIAVLALVGVVGAGLYSLTVPALEWIERAPESLPQVQEKLVSLKKPMQKVTDATEQVQKLATMVDDPGKVAVQEVRVHDNRLSDVLLGTASRAFTSAVVMIILMYFLLASGDMFLRKLVRVTPRLSGKKTAVAITHQVKSDMSAYLFTVTMINVGLGVAQSFFMWALGMPNPLLWGVMGAALNYIPYLGAGVGTIIVGAVSILTFPTLGESIWAPFAYFMCTVVEGNFVTPVILGRRLTLNPVVIFISLLFWSWIWGIPGAFLAVPLLAIFKIFCDHLDPLKPIGEFLGGKLSR